LQALWDVENPRAGLLAKQKNWTCSRTLQTLKPSKAFGFHPCSKRLIMEAVGRVF
jgi:hypothetical protein